MGGGCCLLPKTPPPLSAFGLAPMKNHGLALGSLVWSLVTLPLVCAPSNALLVCSNDCALFCSAGSAMCQSQQIQAPGFHPAPLSSMQYHQTNYHTMMPSNYPGQPSPGYQWTAAGYPGQMPSGSYPGPPSGPVYPGQGPGRSAGGVNNDVLQSHHHINSMQPPYQQFNSSTPGGATGFS